MERRMSLRLSRVALSLAGTELIKPFDLEVGSGEIVTLMGPSGCGKSSLLSGIAGALQPPLAMTGEVFLDGLNLERIAPQQRRMGRLFQDDLLFPHMSVIENLLFGMARGPREERLRKAQGALGEVGLDGFANRPPHTLSGGQRQRASLMRSLLAEPAAMLLDEPFNKLDQDLRARLRSTTFELLRVRGTPTVLVTHDAEDVPAGGRILKIENGEVNNA